MQKTIVLNHLNRNIGITSMVAFQEYGITRLSAVIFDLRKAGHDIISVPFTEKNRYGNTVNFVEYRLADKVVK